MPGVGFEPTRDYVASDFKFVRDFCAGLRLAVIY
jgi:hypothetical protein